jgi:hypothetical protein
MALRRTGGLLDPPLALEIAGTEPALDRLFYFVNPARFCVEAAKQQYIDLLAGLCDARILAHLFAVQLSNYVQQEPLRFWWP